uniref:Putative VRR-NUC domain-containing protein n=1 Tax=viral metagenome TaxID=1070528 RepID=A0A6H1ZEW9_9ZZZZ
MTWTLEELEEALKNSDVRIDTPDLGIARHEPSKSDRLKPEELVNTMPPKKRSHPEADFQNIVVQLAKTLGFMVHAERPARTKDGWRTPIQGDAGFPDVVLAHPVTGNIIILELKSAEGRVSLAQQAWIDCLQKCGLHVFVKRDNQEDWDWLVEVLTKLAGKERA